MNLCRFGLGFGDTLSDKPVILDELFMLLKYFDIQVFLIPELFLSFNLLT